MPQAALEGNDVLVKAVFTDRDVFLLVRSSFWDLSSFSQIELMLKAHTVMLEVDDDAIRAEIKQTLLIESKEALIIRVDLAKQDPRYSQRVLKLLEVCKQCFNLP